MMSAKPKRRYRSVLRMPIAQWPICQACGVVCVIPTGGSSKKTDGDAQTQYRECPKCGRQCKTVVR